MDNSERQILKGILPPVPLAEREVLDMAADVVAAVSSMIFWAWFDSGGDPFTFSVQVESVERDGVRYAKIVPTMPASRV